MPRLILESFDPPRSNMIDEIIAGTPAGEEARLAAYENGYKAGWDDAAAHEADEQARIRADLARNLQTLSFTYHEARAAVLKSLAPLLREIVARVLPDLARDTLAHTVAERLLPLAGKAADVPVLLTCSVADHDTLTGALDGQDHLPLTVSVDPLLAEGQVHLRLGETEEQIDLNSAIGAIANAVTAYFATDPMKEHQIHG
ncbi:flagellar biosynthesis/type III secretory pathway protein FliH [Rhodobacteraceae bacterium MBR-64]|jgi:flagellar assembly protein FliH